MDQGFSLTEVLVSLLLMTTTSLALLKQQWSVSQLFNQMYSRSNAVLHLDNAVERLHIGYTAVTTELPYTLRYSPFVSSNHYTVVPRPHVINVQITWAPALLVSQNCCSLVRQVVTDA